MVVHLARATSSAPADKSFDPAESLTCRLNVKATAALDRARNMPDGAERAGTMREAIILGNAAEMLRHFDRRGS
jgi:hypothetical protein